MRSVLRLMSGGLLLLAFASGCLNAPRSDYNEVAFFSGRTLGSARNDLSAPPEGAFSMWPLYLTNGSASYFLWPFIKVAPEHVAVLPFYNYDHGIHDIALLCTLSPKTHEYRVFPFYWKNRQGWTFVPFAYSYGDATNYIWGSPLLFNVYANSRERGHLAFPFYSYNEKKNGDFTFKTALFGRYREGYKTGHYTLPFYLSEKDEQQNSTSFYSLLFNRYDDPTKRWHFSFPFYGYTLNKKTGDFAFISLFYNRDEDKDTRGHFIFPLYSHRVNKHSGHTTFVSLPFSFYEDDEEYGHVLLPFYSYEKHKQKEDYAFDSWAYSERLQSAQKTEQYTLGKPTSSTRSYSAGLGIPFIGHAWEETWKGTLEMPMTERKDYRFTESRWAAPIWWCGHDNQGHDWNYLMPLWWSWKTPQAGVQNRLLLPFFLSRTYDTKKRFLATPFAGWGSDETAETRWWYCLAAGATHHKTAHTNWLLPFYWHSEEAGADVQSRYTWTLLGDRFAKTPLAASDNAPGESGWRIGPIFPFVTGRSTTAREERFNILLGLGYNSKQTYLTTPTQKPFAERLAPLEETRSLLGSLLFKHDRYYAPLRQLPNTQRAAFADTLPRDLGTQEGCSFSLLADLYAYRDITHYEKDTLLQQRDIGRRETAFNLGWLLWNQRRTTMVGADLNTFTPNKETFTQAHASRLLLGLWSQTHEANYVRQAHQTAPTSSEFAWSLGWSLLGYAREQRTWAWSEAQQQYTFSPTSYAEYGNLLFSHRHQIDEHGNRVAGNYENELLFSLLYRQKAATESNGNTTYREGLLMGFPYLHETTQTQYAIIDDQQQVHTGGTTRTKFTASFLGLLQFKREIAEREQGYGHLYDYRFKDKHRCRYCSDKQPCARLNYRKERDETGNNIGLGLLYHRSVEAERRWERHSGKPEGEHLIDESYTDDRYVGLGIPYQWHGQRDGSYQQTAAFGLLFDQTVNVTDETESFGLLGFLYRYNKYKDGTTTRFIFPFITTRANEAKGTWSISFLHKLFRREKREDGSTKTWLFWL